MEGLAEVSTRAALRMHASPRTPRSPLEAARQPACGHGVLRAARQRPEQLELPEFFLKQIGAADALPEFSGEGGGGTKILPYVVPAAQAAEELSLDNVALASGRGAPSDAPQRGRLRPGAAVVGVPEAYDAALEAPFRGCSTAEHADDAHLCSHREVRGPRCGRPPADEPPPSRRPRRPPPPPPPPPPAAQGAAALLSQAGRRHPQVPAAAHRAHPRRNTQGCDSRVARGARGAQS